MTHEKNTTNQKVERVQYLHQYSISCSLDLKRASLFSLDKSSLHLVVKWVWNVSCKLILFDCTMFYVWDSDCNCTWFTCQIYTWFVNTSRVVFSHAVSHTVHDVRDFFPPVFIYFHVWFLPDSFLTSHFCILYDSCMINRGHILICSLFLLSVRPHFYNSLSHCSLILVCWDMFL